MNTVLFDSLAWLDEDPREYVDDFLACVGRTKEDFKDEDELLGKVAEWLQDNTERYWDDFLEECSDEKGYVLVTGYFMAWDGPREGGKVYADLRTAVRGIIMDDSHPIFSLTDDGVLVLDETHHDTPCKGNHYEFKVLTSNGKKYYEKHINDDRRTLHEALKEKDRSRNVNPKIFGFDTVTLK